MPNSNLIAANPYLRDPEFRKLMAAQVADASRAFRDMESGYTVIAEAPDAARS